MKVLHKHTTWPLYECLSPEDLVALIQYQHKTYGLMLELLARGPTYRGMDGEIESVEEIDQLMRQPTRFKRPPK